ncbi:MAG: hypothetical protein ACREXR_22295, partial [Gammaproteobacteria bacterium]
VRGALSRQARGSSIISPHSHTSNNQGLVASCPSWAHEEKLKQLTKKSAGRKIASLFADGGMRNFSIRSEFFNGLLVSELDGSRVHKGTIRTETGLVAVAVDKAESDIG